ncbi:MAG: riboflavin biosynthesis protein RibF [Eubacteriales bacterium]|nr:riboflavin biosynthesis protein RibF [Eubacteriales bacterium]
MIEKDAKRAIALGFFDGVHCGHRALMDMAVRRAKENGAISSVFTFDVHPDTVITGNPVPLITSNADRGAEIRALGGVDEVIFARFDDHLRNMDWRDFIHTMLVEKFHACWIITGENNSFGYRGLGRPEGLRQECEKIGIGCDIIPSVRIDDVVVSSTYIRQQIAAGKMERARQFLGHPYTIAGVVQHGRRVGRTIGIPTVNLALPEEMQAPPFGVYASRVIVDGEAHLAATNIGLRPTFRDGGAPTVEPHILDYDGDLYGKFIRVELYHFVRPERKFSDPEQLRQSIAQDIAEIRGYFAGM